MEGKKEGRKEGRKEASTELCRQSCHAVEPSFASPSNTETTSLATSQIPDWLQDCGANIQVEDDLGADVSVKSDLDLRAETVSTICRRSTSTDTTCKNCHQKTGFQVCMIWNALPRDLSSSQSLLTFRHKLKTFYFKLAFNLTDEPVNFPCLRFVV